MNGIKKESKIKKGNFEIFTTTKYENTIVFAKVDGLGWNPGDYDALFVAELTTKGIIDHSTWQVANYPLVVEIEDVSHVECLAYMDFTYTRAYTGKLDTGHYGFYEYSNITAK
tara:strand:- start:1056 stop:1394 length:339 start_codon:yes stop_codon:yes gene_type:complete